LPDLPPLSFEGAVTASSDDGSIRVEGRGDQVIVTLDQRAWRSLRRLTRGRRGVTHLAERGIDLARATVQVRVNNRTIATAGRGVNPNWLAAWLGLRPFRIRPIGLLAASVG
jgi:hypothetical protein